MGKVKIDLVSSHRRSKVEKTDKRLNKVRIFISKGEKELTKEVEAYALEREVNRWTRDGYKVSINNF